MTVAVHVEESSIPTLPRGVRLSHDAVRNCWMLVAPERMLVLDEVALEVLRLVDGQRTVGSMADALAERYQAPRAVILTDIVEMLQDLADKRAIRA